MIITRTPLRISLAGGGTDLPAYYEQGEGAVVSASIDKFVHVLVNERFDEKIYLSYSRKEIIDRVDDIEHELVREAMRKTGLEKGVEIHTMADIPSEGSGLGSSSSFTVGLLNAFYNFQGIQVTAEQLAREACDIEINILGKPIGKQDQYIAAYGGLRFFRFHPDGSVDVEHLPIGRERQELGSRLMLFYTNRTRKADPILREQSAKSQERRKYLDDIRQLAYDVREAILKGAYHEVGETLRENWQLKKRLAGGITDAEIDTMVEQAMQGGATGCKISGAGGGGFLLTYCPREMKNTLRRTMGQYKEMPFFLERQGSRVIFNMQGYEWK